MNTKFEKSGIDASILLSSETDTKCITVENLGNCSVPVTTNWTNDTSSRHRRKTPRADLGVAFCRHAMIFGPASALEAAEWAQWAIPDHLKQLAIECMEKDKR